MVGSVLDHVVTLPEGQLVLNPMRVVCNGEGSEVMFTLFQLGGMSDGQFAKDAKMVEADLQTLKAVLEATVGLGRDVQEAQLGTWVHMPANLKHSIKA